MHDVKDITHHFTVFTTSVHSTTSTPVVYQYLVCLGFTKYKSVHNGTFNTPRSSLPVEVYYCKTSLTPGIVLKVVEVPLYMYLS
jgi:hypothetical protein